MNQRQVEQANRVDSVMVGWLEEQLISFRKNDTVAYQDMSLEEYHRAVRQSITHMKNMLTDFQSCAIESTLKLV